MSRRIEFSAKVRDQAAQRANGRCQSCKCDMRGKAVEFDHILPAALGGEASLANCQVLCEACHKAKTGKHDVPRIRKADRQRRAENGSKLAPRVKIKSRGFDPSGSPLKTGKARIKRATLPPRQIYEAMK